MKKTFSNSIFGSNSWDIIKRLSAEFWAPLILSIGWTSWNWHTSSVDYDFVEKWIINFFAFGWAFGQWNRVKKQKKTEDGFLSVENRIGEVVTKLEKNAERQIGMTTGGNSFAELVPTPFNSLDPRSFGLMHRGDYPLYDLTVKIVDLQRIDEVGDPQASNENIYSIDVLAPGHVRTILLNSLAPRLSLGEVRRYNVFITARNGSTVQMFQMTHVNGILRTATAIDNGIEEFYSDAAHDYPKDENGNVDWSKHERRIKLDLNNSVS